MPVVLIIQRRLWAALPCPRPGTWLGMVRRGVAPEAKGMLRFQMLKLIVTPAHTSLLEAAGDGSLSQMVSALVWGSSAAVALHPRAHLAGMPRGAEHAGGERGGAGRYRGRWFTVRGAARRSEERRGEGNECRLRNSLTLIFPAPDYSL